MKKYKLVFQEKIKNTTVAISWIVGSCHGNLRHSFEKLNLIDPKIKLIRCSSWNKKADSLFRRFDLLHGVPESLLSRGRFWEGICGVINDHVHRGVCHEQLTRGNFNFTWLPAILWELKLFCLCVSMIASDFMGVENCFTCVFQIKAYSSEFCVCLRVG